MPFTKIQPQQLQLPTFLSPSGDFTFQNNYTTDYIIENNSALYTENFIAFDYDTSYFTMNFNNASTSDPYTDLWDNDNGT